MYCKNALCPCVLDQAFPCERCHQVISVQKQAPRASSVRRALVAAATSSEEAVHVWLSAHAAVTSVAQAFFFVAIIRGHSWMLFFALALGALALFLSHVLARLPNLFDKFKMMVELAALETVFGLLALCCAPLIHPVTWFRVASAAAFALFIIVNALLLIYAVFVHQQRRMSKFYVTACAGAK
jgi:hypothetical protein